MISPYVVAAQLGCHLDVIAAEMPGYLLPATGTAIQRRMGQNVFACAGVGIGVTNIQAAPVAPNCDPTARYAVDAAIARTCAVEFNKDGQTLNTAADVVAQTMSLDAAALWQAFGSYAPLVTFQITGGLSVVSAVFTLDEFSVPACAYMMTASVLLDERLVTA